MKSRERTDINHVFMYCLYGGNGDGGKWTGSFNFPLWGGRNASRRMRLFTLRQQDIKIFFTKHMFRNVATPVGDQTYSIYKKLDEIEEELKGMGFVRIHKSFLVNLRYVDKISSYVLYLSNGRELSVPKARYPAVKKQYMQYIGK